LPIARESTKPKETSKDKKMKQCRAIYTKIIKGELPLANKLGRDMCVVCRKSFSNFKAVTAYMEKWLASVLPIFGPVFTLCPTCKLKLSLKKHFTNISKKTGLATVFEDIG